MYKGMYRNQFDFFATGSMALFSMGFSVYAIFLVGEIAMTQPLPPLVLGFFILAAIFGVMALYNGIRMFFAPKDTRLDDLIKAVKELSPNIAGNDSSDITDIATGVALIIRAIGNMSKEKKQK